MKPILKRTIIVVIFIVMLVPFGIFLGIKNTSDYQSDSLELSEISANVKVYRDEKGIPTIIAENEADLFFAQGYEMARDRLWQMEFLKSVGNGELTRLVGDDFLSFDKYLRVLSMNKAAERVVANADPVLLQKIESFVAGVNKYIEIHENNLPLEFMLAGGDPTPWTAKDAIVIQGVMARTLSLRGMNTEFIRYDLAKAIGPEKALELYPMDYQPAADFYLNYDFETDTDGLQLSFKQTEAEIMVDALLGEIGLDNGIGSNNWVISGDHTESGSPIVNNDPHLELSTPSIWWQVQLVAPGYHVEGFSLPGVPGIVLGHNEHIAWGVTNTGTDAVDTYYFKVNDDQSQYFHDGTWKDFELDVQSIPKQDGSTVEYTIKRTVYGPVLDPDVYSLPDDKVYVLRWTLYEDHERNDLLKAVLGMNYAKDLDDIHTALNYWSVPGQNIVYATVDGDIGYQYTGLTPIRKSNTYGVIPLNGSLDTVGWEGFVDYEGAAGQYRVENPAKGYFSTANEKIDTRDLFYINDRYAIGYRGERIKQVIDVQLPGKISIDDMEDLQADTINLYANDILDPYIEHLESLSFAGEELEDYFNDAVEFLGDWDKSMDRKSVGATLFAAWRIYFEEYTIRDELDAVNETLFPRAASMAKYLLKEIASDYTNEWFDDKSTPEIETGKDIAEKAFRDTVTYLREVVGINVKSWRYEKVHEVTFNHVMGSVPVIGGILNEGGIASDGSTHTVIAGGSPSWTAEGPAFGQSNGPSMRFIAEVEPSWANVQGILAPGSSGHLLNKHRGDGVEDWVDNVYHQWNFRTAIEGEVTFTFIKI